MAKLFRVAFTVISAFFLALIMFVFPTKPGVDCIAGCTQGIGFPFDAYTSSSAGIASSDGSIVTTIFPFIGRISQVYIIGFVADIIIYLVLIVLIYKFLAWMDKKLF